jgi:hypothetical protein
MAIGVYFHPVSMNAGQYQEILKRLSAAGAGAPKGRLYHCCIGEGNELQVFDVFDSQADLDAFAAVMVPITNAVNVDPGQPMVSPVHNIIVG